jgi:16S rRNA (uracil1498-N3)-methyltransferase
LRQLVLYETPFQGKPIPITGKEYQYLIKVLRLKAGDTLDMRIPGGTLVSGVISEVSGKSAIIRLSEGSETNKAGRTNSMNSENGVCAAELTGPVCGIWLFQWLPKGQKMDAIIRYAAETGVETIVPVAGEFSVAKDAGAGKTERWERIVREARQQSGSPVDTQLLRLHTTEEAIACWQTASEGISSRALVLSENPESASQGLHTALEGNPRRIAIAVGPEGGISPNEQNLLESGGFLPIHFRTNVLRTETAALYGIAAIQTILSEYDSWHGNA